MAARCATEAFSTICAVHVEDCEGWWLSICCGSVAEHWWIKACRCPGFDSRRLPAFFTFLYFCLITSKSRVGGCLSVVAQYVAEHWWIKAGVLGSTLSDCRFLLFSPHIFQLEARCSQHLKRENHSAWVLFYEGNFLVDP